MKDNKQEPLLTQLAKQYLEEDGRRLQKEAAQLETHVSTPMPAVDGKVKRFRASHRRGRYVAAFSAVAAGLLLLFLLPRLEKLSPSLEAPPMTYADETATLRESYTAPHPAADASVESNAMADEAESRDVMPDALAMEPSQRAVAAPKDAAPQAPAAAYIKKEEAAPSAAAPLEEATAATPKQDALAFHNAPDDIEEAAAPAPDIIPLSFALPAGFTVDSVRQDEGETIYRLANAALDDVILSVADADTAPLASGGLVEIGGETGDTAYGLAGADVQFLTFEQDGLRYRLTCRHDIQTLLSLWQYIVSA